MKSIYFGNQKSYEITSPEIKKTIKRGMNFLYDKNYTFLNKKNIENLKDIRGIVSLSTFGKKFFLYITVYDNKNWCIFINKKNDDMILTQINFQKDIFQGTLFDGEMVKTNENKWIYIINDMYYYKGKDITDDSFENRQEGIDLILKTLDEKENFNLSKKQYIEYCFIKDLVENYMPRLNYKCCGLYFKNMDNIYDNYLFIFPECRIDNTVSVKNEKGAMKDDNDVMEKDALKNEKGAVEKDAIEKGTLKNEKDAIEKGTLKNEKDALKNEKGRIFKIEKTEMSDIYRLFCKKNSGGEFIFYKYCGVPDLLTSTFLRDLFDFHKEDICIQCIYHSSFKKWVPFMEDEASCKILFKKDECHSVEEIQKMEKSLPI